MFDQRAYLKDKRTSKLSQSSVYFATYGGDFSKIRKLIDSMDNLDIMPKNGADFDSSTVSLIQFCKIIEELVAHDTPLTLGNFREQYNLEKTQNLSNKATSTVRAKDEIDSSLLNTEALYIERMQRLAELIQEDGEDDITETFDDEELTEEGLRNRGLIGPNETSLDAVNFKIKKSDVPCVILSDINEPIISPYTGTEEIYQIDSSTYMDIETEEIFKIKYKD